jgi:tRNA-2-methylthio-N6-dimethylallyladenosine synthase
MEHDPPSRDPRSLGRSGVAAELPDGRGRFFVQTFGCQMNVHDSDRLTLVLLSHGFRPAETADGADLIVLNTCSVREKAEQKLRSLAGKLAKRKRAQPDLVLCVAGCVAQQEGEKLLARIPHLDLVVGPDNLAEIPALVLAARSGQPPTARTVFDLDRPRFLAASPRPGQAPASAFVTTMKGCDERCSFCVVPYTRGPERYRSASEIEDEVHRWVSAGAREIVLLGQTVDSFRDATLPPPPSDDPDETQFPELLRILSRVPGLMRLRYTSPHPRHATASLARAHAELDVLARHIHLPVQSGSDRILRRMIRRYTRTEYVERVRRFQAARSGLTLSTDIIVGFPGETEADFRETLSLVREVGFTSLFGFKFSPRPHTPALRLADDVSEEEKSERLARLFEVAETQRQARLDSLVGTRQQVLFEGGQEGQRPDEASGRNENSEIVHVATADGRRLVAQLLAVEIVAANKHSLVGRLPEATLASLSSSVTMRPSKPRSLPVLA